MAYAADGRTVRESTRTQNKKVAQRVYAERVSAVTHDRFDISLLKRSPRFADYADEYLNVYSKNNKKPQSIGAIKSRSRI